MKSFKVFPHVFEFKNPAGTSRGVMTQKRSWFIELKDEMDNIGWGECSIIENLSPDFINIDNYEYQLNHFLNEWKTNHINFEELQSYPSMCFGLETASLDMNSGGKQVLFDTPFTRGQQEIRINGLIWMGSADQMSKQIEEKIEAGFRCIKLKIGAIDWADEYRLLKSLRASFSASEIEIRVDANGAYSANQASTILDKLAALEIHSIEQPIKAGNWSQMAELCANTPCPIALDEELIGINNLNEKEELLAHIKPQFIILKPSLHGGISGTKSWIELAEKSNIQWWMTSALESNLGLNAIAQLASTYNLQLPQGLGTGSLYMQNIPSPLELHGEMLQFNDTKNFDLSVILGN